MELYLFMDLYFSQFVFMEFYLFRELYLNQMAFMELYPLIELYLSRMQSKLYVLCLIICTSLHNPSLFPR